MKRQTVVMSLVLLSLTASAVANELLYKSDYRSGELIVRFDETGYAKKPPRPAEKVAARQRVLTSAGGGTVKHMLDRRVSGLSVVKLPAGVSVQEALAFYKNTPGILYVEPNYKLRLCVIPNDTRFNELWGMHNTGQTGGTPDADIDAPEAWNINTGSSNVIVAVTDIGVDYNHPDLAANMWVNPGEIPGNGIDDDGNGYIDDIYGCDTGDNDGNPMDNSADAGHGTHVSGTIGAVGNNAQGVAGVCWHVSIMAVKIADANGDIWLDAAIDGIQYAIDKGAKVINASWGGYSYSQAEYDVIATARDAGILFVAAAGNDSLNNDSSPFYPASLNLNNVISVMATNNGDGMSYYSNYGSTSVDIGAPGGDMRYGNPGGILSCLPNANYGYMQGTSMAAPHITGACALLRAANPTLSYTQIKDALLNSADSRLSGLCASGGRLNLSRAVTVALEDHTPPVPNPAEWQVEPNATGLHTIAMTAKTATDDSGVEYYFECNVGDFNSGWQDSALYVNSNYNANTLYSFRVKARDKSDFQNETDWSNSISTTTASGVDNLPPSPNPSQWKAAPRMLTTTMAGMEAWPATDESTPVKYFFDFNNATSTGSGGTDSGWQTSSAYIDAGLNPTPGLTYTYRVKARDGLGKETGWSTEMTITIAIPPTIRYVPSPLYGTIQAAINASNNPGDIVIVHPGTYTGLGNRDLDFGGRQITVKSENPDNPDTVAATIIDCNGNPDTNDANQYHRGFDFHSGEGASSIVSGFTITNGYIRGTDGPNGVFPGGSGNNGGNGSGGAIICTGSSPTILNCAISNCVVQGGYGGDGADGNEAVRNGGYGRDSGSALGGAIYCDGASNPTIRGCQIINCRAIAGIPGDGGDGYASNVLSRGRDGGNCWPVVGGGIFCDFGSSTVISDCVITQCRAISGVGGIGGTGPAANGQNGSDGQSFAGGVYYAMWTSIADINDTEISWCDANDDVGGIYFDFSAGTRTTLTCCDILNNTAGHDAGGIGYVGGGTLTLNNCNVSGNRASGYGGGICAGNPGIATTVDVNNNTTISDNIAFEGGGVCVLNAHLTIDDSVIGTTDATITSGNAASYGAGLYGGASTVDINNSIINSNVATEDGAGFYCDNSAATIKTCTFTENDAGGGGGAMYFSGYDPTQQIINCLITKNSAYDNGAGISCNFDVVLTMTNCTLVDNAVSAVYGSGGGVSCYSAFVGIDSSILWNNSAVYGPQIAVGDPLVPDNPSSTVMPTYSDFEGGDDAVFVGPAQGPWGPWLVPSSTNIDEDPLFAYGYYLSQSPTQLVYSNCVDGGNPLYLPSYLAADVGFTPTTCTNHKPDAEPLDMGYHYNAAVPVTMYQLTVMVVNSGFGTNGTVAAPSLDPNTYTYKTYSVEQGTVVEFAATPDPNYEVSEWTGTDSVPFLDPCDPNRNTVMMNSNKTVTVEFDTILPSLRIFILSGQGTTVPEPYVTHTYPYDTVVNIVATPNDPAHAVRWSGDVDNPYATTRTNTVTMTAVPKNKEVYVEFYAVRHLYVPAEYPTLQVAIDAAEDGDIIILDEADQPYYTSWGYEIYDKAITITSPHPDDPCCVVRTVIEQQAGPQANTGPAFRFYNVKPDTILNGLTIRRFGGQAYSGLDADPAENGYYDGEPGSDAYGAAIWCGLPWGQPASPTIKNCVIEDCTIRGGNGGNGADGDADHPDGGNGGWPGAAYGGGMTIFSGSDPIITNCTFNNCAVIGGNAGDGGGAVDDPGGSGGRGGGWYYYYTIPSPWEYGPFEFYTRYGGFGGAVYVDYYCSPIFTDCNFINNNSEGGFNGICGLNQPVETIDEPSLRYKIDNFGGAVFCQEGSDAKFVGCTFTNNLADPNRPHLDPAVAGSYENNKSVTSFGGAVAFGWNGYGTVVKFDNCTFRENFGCYGGAIYGTFSEPNIVDCDFTTNSAYSGGAAHFAGGLNKIIRSIFSGNEANSAVAQGGAICNLGANALIEDCQINYNSTRGSGGGIYVSSHDADGVELSTGDTVLIKNCLITRNVATRDGGGISANWYSDPNIVNCTIADNTGLEYGGGVYCSYNSYANIINSIIWNNIGINGSQLTIATNYEYDQRLSTVDVSYSDVGVRAVKYEPIDANGLPTIRPGFDANSLAANDDQSTGLVDIGFEIGFFGKTYSQLYVNNNGNVTFDANMWTYTPFGLTGDIGTPIIAPFFADVDTRPGTVDTNALTRYGTGMVDGHAAFGVTWIDVGYFNTHWDKVNSFQLILIDRSDRAPGDFDVEFNHEKIQWETGDASGGVNGFGGYSARAGFSNGTGDAGTFYEFEGSGVPGAFLDSNPTGLIYGSRKSAVNGRYIFAVLSGLPELLPTTPIYVDVNCTLNGWDWNVDTNNWEPNFVDYRNISEDPLFVAGYYLSHKAVGQKDDSNAIDAGSDLASLLGLDTYTTRVDGVPDDANVDMGYHYIQGVAPYKLTIEVVGTNGRVRVTLPGEPNGYDVNVFDVNVFDVNQYATVQLQALPDSNYTVKKWTGTDDDGILDSNNTVTMYSDRTVTVEFVKAFCQLIIEAGPGGTVASPWEPNIYNNVPANTKVNLQAVPDEGYRVKRWIEDDNDMSTDPCYTVTTDPCYTAIMDLDEKTVRVEFEQPQTLIVAAGGGQGGYYSNIQDAVSDAKDGDTIVVYPGTYSGGYFGVSIYVDKPITITSTHPDDPCCVATTIIDGYMGSQFNEGWNNIGITFGPHTNAGTILDGLTIQNCGGYWGDGEDGDREEGHPNGYEGGMGIGDAIRVYSGGPVIKNCIIRNNVVIGGTGGDGVDADDTLNAGRGGWGGTAWGGAVYCGANSSPTFINCQIIDNYAGGGNGGGGGNGTEDGGLPNYGGNWSMRGTPEYPAIDINPNGLGINYETDYVTDGDLWERWGYLGDYRWYSAYGGGVFCGIGSTVTFEHCTISGNITAGGVSGQGGEQAVVPRPFEPLIPYEIPTFGGGVYCAAESTITFTDCTITNNTASEPNANNNHIDQYLGHGGGVCAEDTATLIFTNCTFSENTAAVGGGTYFADANPTIRDCNFISNSAFQGGGLLGEHGPATILRSHFTNNIASSDANDPNTLGMGGGMYFWATDVNIIDCNVMSNQAEYSGGGVYLGGEGNNISVFNCLVTNNTAGRDGGGLSVNWYATPLITNCTIVDNEATGNFGVPGETGLGGGIYSGYRSHTVILNSILWDNYALQGRELAIGTGLEYDPRPSTVDVNYSDIKGAQANVFIDAGCTLNWGTGNIYVDPCFVTGPLGDYYLSQTDTNDPNQTVDSPCVDAGNDQASNVGLYHLYTTRTDEVFDTSIVDMGYHYPLAHPIEICSFSDLSHDGIVNFDDLAIFGLYWLNEGCSDSNGWCGGADLTFDTYVNSYDLTFLNECWLAEDTEPPSPSPSKWEIWPYSIPPDDANMVAEAAFDDWGGDVKYYFECVTGNDSNRPWDDPNSLNRTYPRYDLDPNTVYGYKVKARDERGNETQWSEDGYIIAGEEAPPTQDHNPPTPNPMTWATPPHATLSTSIAMEANTATDDTAGVQYYFEDFNNPDVNSGWQSSPTWVDTTCAPQTMYTYRVKARDTSFWHNETGWSDLRSATTPATPPPSDNTPPLPNPSQWAVGGEPMQYGPDVDGYYHHTMTAELASDATTGGNDPVQYYFEFVTGGIGPHSSGWQLSNVYDYPVSTSSSQYGVYRVRTKDAVGKTTGWSEMLSTLP